MLSGPELAKWLHVNISIQLDCFLRFLQIQRLTKYDHCLPATSYMVIINLLRFIEIEKCEEAILSQEKRLFNLRSVLISFQL